MKGTWKALAPTVLAFAMALQAAPPPGKGGGNGGGGGDGGGDPSNTPIIARFAAGGQVESDGQGNFNGDYVDSALGSKGWSQLPGTGNYTLQLNRTGREAILHFNQLLENGAPGSVLPDDGDGNLDFQTELFTSINRRDCYDPITGQEYLDPGTGQPVPPADCPTGEFRNTGDGLRDMTLNQTIAASVYVTMPGAYKMQCSQDPGNPLIGSGAPGENPDLDFAAVTCQSELNGVCSEWLVRGVDNNPDGSLLRCGLYQRVGKGKSATDQHVGDFEMNFSLALFLDANNNGTPDQDE